MRVLPFKITKQQIVKNGDFAHIAKGTKNYLQCKFEFENTEDWDGYMIVAVFENQHKESARVVSDGLTCMVPDEMTDSKYFKIRLIGVKGGRNRITTNRELVSQEG